MNRKIFYLSVLVLTGLSLLSSCLQSDMDMDIDEDDCLSSHLLAPINSSYNSAWVSPLLGEPPYTYLWSNGATTDTISNLPRTGGTFTVTVTDSEGCTMDNSIEIAPWGCPAGTTSITDSEGNTYQVVEIGGQCWMAENLKASGNAQQVTDDNQWENLSSAAWCYNDNDPTTGGTYGKLYNGWAILNGNLCPSGWHVPTSDDWADLSKYLGGSTIAGGKMKVAGTGYWQAPNTGATNSSGFSALPGGSRSSNGDFSEVSWIGQWWSSTDNTGSLYFREIRYDSERLRGGSTHPYRIGISCRCVKD